MSRHDETTMILDAIAGRRPNGKNEVRANCCFCEIVVHKTDRKACLSVNLVSGLWRCYRCESKGKLNEAELPFNASTVPVHGAKEAAPPVNLPEGFVPLFSTEGQASFACGPARKYLSSRRIDARIIEAARIGCCLRGKMQGRVVVPIYKAGKLAGYVGRIWKQKGEFKYRYNEGFDRASTLYNEEALYKTTSAPAYIVEGVFDTFPFWPDACAVLGTASAAQVEMMTRAHRPLLIVFDGDAHRKATALAMTLRMAGVKAAALRLPPGKDPDELVEHVKEKAREAFENKEEERAT